MARVTKPQDFTAKRNAILDATRRLVFTLGYEQMSVQDVLNQLQISGGAFHHYFDSRGALLDALVERILDESTQPLLPIVHDPRLTAVQKLQGFLSALDQVRLVHQQEVIDALRVWYTDGNALVRQRVAEALVKRRAPLLTEIVRQGVREGHFDTSFPDEAGGVIMALLQGLGDTQARLLLSIGSDPRSSVEATVATHAAYLEAIERVLGLPPETLDRATPDAVAAWIRALQLPTMSTVDNRIE